MPQLDEKNDSSLSLLTDFQPSRGKDELVAKVRSAKLSIYSIAVLLTITNFITIMFLLVTWTKPQGVDHGSCTTDLDPWGNEIPHKYVVWEEDPRYVESMPKVFYNQTSGDEHSIWGRIFPTAWVELVDNDKVGGAMLKDWGSAEEDWPEGSQVWPVTLMHQLHCLATMKTSYQLLEDGEILNHERLSHFPHCIEYLRHSVLCQADLTLEKTILPHKWPLGTTGWGNAHKCRDLDAVMAAISEHGLLRGEGKWYRMPKQP